MLLEDPGFLMAHGAFRNAAGADLLYIPIDSKGAAPARTDFRNARLMYVTPGHQVPSWNYDGPQQAWSKFFSTRANQALLFWKTITHSEYRYSGHPVPAMQGLDRDNLVIFAGSFNKVLFPSLRMGYMVLPPVLLEKFVTWTKTMISRHRSLFRVKSWSPTLSNRGTLGGISGL